MVWLSRHGRKSTEWIPTPNVGWKVGAGDQWDNNTLFDFHGNALSSLDAFRRR
ncbi:arabinogalactan endo-1,4-beta-galactosidase [Paraburkholderia sp. RAU6.4a]